MTNQLSVIPSEGKEPDKIKDMHPQTLAIQMQSLMKLICGDFGLAYPAKEVMSRICEILFTTKGHWDLADVRTMFQLNLYGKLDHHFYKDKNGGPDKHHYSKMTPEYWMKVTVAYEKYLQDSRMRVGGNQNQKLLGEVKVTREEKIEGIKAYLRIVCDWYENEYPKPLLLMGHPFNYRIFMRCGLVPKSGYNILCLGYVKPTGAERKLFDMEQGNFSFQYTSLIMEACEKLKKAEQLKISTGLRDLIKKAYGYEL